MPRSIELQQAAARRAPAFHVVCVHHAVVQLRPALKRNARAGHVWALMGYDGASLHGETARGYLLAHTAPLSCAKGELSARGSSSPPRCLKLRLHGDCDGVLAAAGKGFK